MKRNILKFKPITSAKQPRVKGKKRRRNNRQFKVVRSERDLNRITFCELWSYLMIFMQRLGPYHKLVYDDRVIWIMDCEGENSMGDLTHKVTMKGNVYELIDGATPKRIGNIIDMS